MAVTPNNPGQPSDHDQQPETNELPDTQRQRITQALEGTIRMTEAAHRHIANIEGPKVIGPRRIMEVILERARGLQTNIGHTAEEGVLSIHTERYLVETITFIEHAFDQLRIDHFFEQTTDIPDALIRSRNTLVAAFYRDLIPLHQTFANLPEVDSDYTTAALDDLQMIDRQGRFANGDRIRALLERRDDQLRVRRQNIARRAKNATDTSGATSVATTVIPAPANGPHPPATVEAEAETPDEIELTTVPEAVRRAN
ncbi:MAG: hypothetical protein Q8P27_02360, partial [Candidatus Peregrinibacteria bacterium]|nr:hypothetical protein [Candidatus Peregrinibacteria bacterium]